jgi:uncharacterized RDD family membrane protein YckC
MPWAPPPPANPLGVPGAPGIEYGSVLSRFVAYWLDGLLVEIVGLIIALVIGGLIGSTGRFGLAGLIAGIVFLGIHLLYFVGFWTGHARATLAMRLMKLSIGSAVDGTTLTVQQGLVRWLAIGGIFQVLSIVPGLSLLAIIAPFWILGLLISTMASPTRQGLHDRAASSAIVQPVGASSSALACLVILAILVGIAILAVASLILLGSQVSNILSAVGSSI